MIDHKNTGLGGTGGKEEENSLDFLVEQELWMGWGRRGRGTSTCSDISQSSSNSCGAERWVLGFTFETFEEANKLPGIYLLFIQ